MNFGPTNLQQHLVLIAALFLFGSLGVYGSAASQRYAKRRNRNGWPPWRNHASVSVLYGPGVLQGSKKEEVSRRRSSYDCGDK
jgi:hypothetical protein